MQGTFTSRRCRLTFEQSGDPMCIKCWLLTRNNHCMPFAGQLSALRLCVVVCKAKLRKSLKKVTMRIVILETAGSSANLVARSQNVSKTTTTKQEHIFFGC